jgi:hypothetical protein
MRRIAAIVAAAALLAPAGPARAVAAVLTVSGTGSVSTTFTVTTTTRLNLADAYVQSTGRVAGLVLGTTAGRMLGQVVAVQPDTVSPPEPMVLEGKSLVWGGNITLSPGRYVALVLGEPGARVDVVAPLMDGAPLAVAATSPARASVAAATVEVGGAANGTGALARPLTGYTARTHVYVMARLDLGLAVDHAKVTACIGRKPTACDSFFPLRPVTNAYNRTRTSVANMGFPVRMLPRGRWNGRAELTSNGGVAGSLTLAIVMYDLPTG